MKCLVQRVTEASVTVKGQIVGKIGQGLVVLVGFTPGDGLSEITWMADKVVHLRIFPDDSGQTARSLLEVDGALLIVSQFTLYGDVRRGRRPDYSRALPRTAAASLYAKFVRLFESYSITPQTGAFGSEMYVHLINWGPVTLLLEREPEHKGETIGAN